LKRIRPFAFIIRNTVYSNVFLVYNPFAGYLQRRPRVFADAVAILRGAGHRVTLAPTAGPCDATAIARRAVEAGADLILVAGGDGTINEAMNGMVGSQTPLAVLPAGTANVLAMELRLGGNVRRAAGMLARMTPRRIAVGRLAGSNETEARHFLLMAGAGLDALLVRQVDVGMKRWAGKGAYWWSAVSMLSQTLVEFEAVVEGRRYPCGFALASRVRNYGGHLAIARGASLLDDVFEVVLFEGARALMYSKYLAGSFLDRLRAMRGVTILRARDVRFEAPAGADVHAQIDGEYAGSLPAAVEIVPGALTLLTPADYRG
jgi:diacylglycerol kinase (ATP)